MASLAVKGLIVTIEAIITTRHLSFDRPKLICSVKKIFYFVKIIQIVLYSSTVFKVKRLNISITI